MGLLSFTTLFLLLLTSLSLVCGHQCFKGHCCPIIFGKMIWAGRSSEMCALKQVLPTLILQKWPAGKFK
jgi:hypothetical protein